MKKVIQFTVARGSYAARARWMEEGMDRSTTSEHYLLVVDDSEARDTLAELLRGMGYGVVTAASGDEALRQMAQRSPPALILLDLKMPGMDALAFRTEQRQDARLAPVPVIALCDENTPEEEAAVAAAGYLCKPIELRELTALFRGVLGAAG